MPRQKRHVEDYLQDHDERLRRLEGRTDGGGSESTGSGTPGPAGPTGPQGPAGPTGYSSGFTFSYAGNLAVTTGAHRLYIPVACNITNVIASVGTAATGADIRVDVNKNGTTIFTTQTTRPNIAAGTFADTLSAPQVTALLANDFLTVDIDQVGSTITGANLTVQIVVTG